ncbi:hypothetical protein [Amphibacillus cookii]|uniref:hypothetical protein n=1 Tax=Amphibacillus cookii TaxID=767787 RepID=UPI00195788EB|nr:hypothetical protein [Amphibacillus cookii]MBM7541647.1 hypothetical protein [Amphibacillus cookii]
MYKQECYKIFTRKSLYLTFLLFIFFMLLPDGSHSIRQTSTYQSLYDEWRGPLTATEIDMANERLMKLEEQVDREMAEADELEGVFPKSIEDQAAHSVYVSVIQAGENINWFEARKENLRDKAFHPTETAYQAEVAQMEFELLQQLNEPIGFYQTTTWSSTVDFINTLGFIFLTVLIILGLAPVFADEHSQKVASLIVSTKFGKTKVAFAKIFASITYIGVLFVSLHVINVLIEISKFGRFVDGTVPLQNLYLFIQSPFSLTIWQYYALALGIQLLASLMIGLLVLFLSIITRHAMLTFFISGTIIGTPVLFRQLGLDQQLIQHMTQFSYAELMRVKGLVDQFIVFRLLGQPILYPYLLIAVFLLIASLNVLLIYWQYRNQQIVN